MQVQRSSMQILWKVLIFKGHYDFFFQVAIPKRYTSKIELNWIYQQRQTNKLNLFEVFLMSWANSSTWAGSGVTVEWNGASGFWSWRGEKVRWNVPWESGPSRAYALCSPDACHDRVCWRGGLRTESRWHMERQHMLKQALGGNYRARTSEMFMFTKFQNSTSSARHLLHTAIKSV